MSSASTRIELVLLTFVTILRLISCECRQSYVTICDSFDDITNDYVRRDWNELIIGTDQSVANESVNLMDVLRLIKFPKLATLHVVKKIKKLRLQFGYKCEYELVDFNLLSLFGNEIKNIEFYQFPQVKIKKFSLVNNKIETIAENAFKFHEIVDFDMSDNLVEDIVQGALPSQQQTKIITIKNNLLTHIDPGSFPSSLKILNLDQNKLRHLQSGVIDCLTALNELTLSNNKFRTFPDLHKLKELIVFNISSNFINSIEGAMFESLTKLKLLDLSSNKLKEQDTLSVLLTPNHHPELIISLAFNYLVNLNLEEVVLKTEKLFLYGNPWDCDVWGNLSVSLSEYQDECDSLLLSKGDSPYCINYRTEDLNFGNFWDQHIERFHDSIPINLKSSCDLLQLSYELLYPVVFTCVA